MKYMAYPIVMAYANTAFINVALQMYLLVSPKVCLKIVMPGIVYSFRKAVLMYTYNKTQIQAIYARNSEHLF